jgi:hypothetical protein
MRRQTILTLGITLGAAVFAHAQAINWMVPQAATACDEVAKATKIVNREKDLKGPFLILWRDAAQAPWAIGKVSPDFIRRLAYEKKDAKNFNPVSVSQVRMVACGTRGTQVKVGEYMILGKATKQPAFAVDFDIRVMEWPSRKPVAQWTERLQPPEYKKETESMVASPDPTNVAIVLAIRMPREAAVR